MATVVPPALTLWLIFLSSSLFQSTDSTSELSLVVSDPTMLQLSPSLLVEKSPASKPGAKVKCERILIHGVPRIKHLVKYAHSVKIKVSCAKPSGCLPHIEVCFHRNASLGIGMCPKDQWERISEGFWVKSMSPFDHKILDVRMAASYSEVLQVSLDEEFFVYRILFLVLGIVMLTLAGWLSKSLVFYYSGAMAIGVLLVVLMVLFQGMKLLPTGRTSSIAIFLYSCFIGFGSFLLSYVPKLLQALLVEIGLSEDMYNPLAIFLLVFLVIFGAWLGFWVVRKLVLTDDGSIDSGVSHFVTWSIRIVASVLILQSLLDPLLAAEALIVGVVVSSVLRRFGRSKVAHHVYKKACRLNKVNLKKLRASPVPTSTSPRPSSRSPYTPTHGPASKSPTRLSDSEAFYSTFHNTPNRRKFRESEWESFTRESTRKALQDLVSTPDFSKWAVDHADRITLAPKNETANKHKRWFHWFYRSS